MGLPLKMMMGRIHMNRFMQKLEVSPENHGLLKTIYFAFFTSGLMSVMLGALLPYLRDEKALSYAQSGMMLSAHQLGNLCAVLAAGAFSRIIGRKNSAVVMGAGSALGFIMMVVTRSVWPLALAFVLTGIGRGTMSNICNVAASEVSGNKAGALSMLHAFFAIGALLSPIIVYLAASNLSWKLSALAVAALSALALYLLARSKMSNASDRGKSGSLSFLKDASFWLNTMILFFYLCAEASIIGWFVIYFEDMGVLPSSIAAFTPSLLWMMIMVGRLVCASLSTRVDPNKLLLALSISFALCFTGMLMSRSAVPCVIFLLGIGLSMAGIYPTTFSTMKGLSSTLATGFIIAIATLGGIIMPGIVGAVSDIYGLAGGVATILAALVGMVALVIVKLLGRRFF